MFTIISYKQINNDCWIMLQVHFSRYNQFLNTHFGFREKSSGRTNYGYGLIKFVQFGERYIWYSYSSLTLKIVTINRRITYESPNFEDLSMLSDLWQNQKFDKLPKHIGTHFVIVFRKLQIRIIKSYFRCLQIFRVYNRSSFWKKSKKRGSWQR